MSRMIQFAPMLALLLSACATLQGEVESLNFPYEPGWKVGHEAEVPRQYRIIEYVRDGDDIKNWKELYTIQNFGPPWGGPSPEDALNSLKAAREKECPGITKWNVISTDESSILYEWQAKPCLGWPDQHEIARIIYGKYNRWVLRYTVKVYQMPPEQRDKWIRDLSTAKTVTRLQ